MTQYRYDKNWPWDIIYNCKHFRQSILLSCCDKRIELDLKHPAEIYTHCRNCETRKSAVLRRAKDMSEKDHTGVMIGCLCCRYCVWYHKDRVAKGAHYLCKKGDKVPLSRIDAHKCKRFILKKFIQCPERNETIECNACLWDYHTRKDYCKNCEIFKYELNSTLKLKKSKKRAITKPKLKLRKKK